MKIKKSFVFLVVTGQSAEEDEEDTKGKAKKGGGKRRARQTVSSFYKTQLGKPLM